MSMTVVPFASLWLRHWKLVVKYNVFVIAYSSNYDNADFIALM